MIIKMDKMSAPSRERAERLYEKNAELESRRRKSAQARVPSDPNIWQQMRENYEAIILEDHAFSEQHNVEHALWQLHYKKIEELRAHYNAAQAAARGGKGPPRPDRITKIRQHFKTFLSEATGFYHDLIMKIRAKYGLPLGFFPDDSENRIDGKNSNDTKKGFISCHRCLIYLGDLARYKGLYGDADSKAREYAAASSYYLQAASLWPSIGNPHHQLAILASYSGDDFVTVYRYFRSLAVESPCSTARDNLIVAFEKNRQSVTQLVGDAKTSTVHFAGRGRGREAKSASKDAENEAVAKGSNGFDAYRSFCIRFVRMNGILFTRTSLETFAEVLSVVSNGLRDLLSTGQEEELNFGTDPSENGLFFVRLVAILIFTVHNAKRESEGQTYAEIVQRAVLLQSALTAIFQIMALILERCGQLDDPSSSYILPCTLVFVEWLACYPDIAAGNDADEKQATWRSNFWDHFISFANKLLSVGLISVDDNEDETCFNNMSRYEEEETENRLALWEDFELRGFMPLHPAHSILDFSRKHNFGNNDHKEKSSRVKRILAAGKSIASVVQIGQKAVHFDSRGKKFVIGDPLKLDELIPAFDSVVPDVNKVVSGNREEELVKVGGLQPNQQFYIEGEEDEEEIVFRPTLSEKPIVVNGSTYLHSGFEPVKTSTINDPPFSGDVVSNAFDNIFNRTAADRIPPEPFSVHGIVSQSMNPVQVKPQNWLLEKELALANGLKDLSLLENGHVIKSELRNNTNIHPLEQFVPIQHSAIPNTAASYSHANALAPAILPPRSGAVTPIGGSAENLAVKPSLSSGYKKNPVSRPVRHLGPPPGFNPVRKQVQEPISGAENPILDDYSWLDGYQMSSSKTSGINNSVTYAANGNSLYDIGGSTGLSAAVSFPFPGKQVPPLQIETDRQKGWQDYQAFSALKPHLEQQLQMSRQMLNGNQDFGHLSEQYLGSVWSGRHFV